MEKHQNAPTPATSRARRMSWANQVPATQPYNSQEALLPLGDDYPTSSDVKSSPRSQAAFFESSQKAFPLIKHRLLCFSIPVDLSS